MTPMERNKINADEFIKIWKREYENDPKMSHFYTTFEGQDFVLFSNIEVVGTIEVTHETIELPRMHFFNSKSTTFSLDNLKASYIKFTESEILNLYLGQNFEIKDLIFDKSIVLKQIGLVLGATCKFLNINDSSIQTIKLEDKSSKIEDITVIDSSIGFINIETNSEAESITLTRTKLNNLKIYQNSNLDFLKINHSKIIQIELRNSTISDYIEIDKSTINEFYIKAKTLPEININDTFIEFFDNKNSISSTFNLEKCEILNFNMSKMRTGKDGLILLKDCKINNLRFDTILNLGGFNISNLKPLKIGKRFNHTKKSRSDDVRSGKHKGKDYFILEPFSIPDSTISILSSDMGKMMISSDLSTFTKFEFHDSKILEVFIAGPKLPEITTITESDHDSQKRIAYNQIKKIYENRGDNVTALDYLSKEMEVYRSQVKNKKDGKIPGELFQLKFNQFTNQHGTEWRFSFLLSIGISLGLFLMYYSLLFGFHVGQFNFNAIPYYFEFLNPAHKSNFIKEFDINNNTLNETLALLIDYSSRLIIPLFLYQMIQAFRKYGKK